MANAPRNGWKMPSSSSGANARRPRRSTDQHDGRGHVGAARAPRARSRSAPPSASPAGRWWRGSRRSGGSALRRPSYHDRRRPARRPRSVCARLHLGAVAQQQRRVAAATRRRSTPRHRQPLRPRVGEERLRIVSFSRSDSRSTMSISCACSAVSGSSWRRIWIEPDIDASGLRISCAMPAAISPTAARRCCIARFALELLDVGDVLEREEEAALAARRHAACAALRPSSIAAPSRRAVTELDARRPRPPRERRPSSAASVAGQLQHVAIGRPPIGAAPMRR